MIYPFVLEDKMWLLLSACRTALADSLEQDGIEINSTAYHFMNRGAKSVIASLWKVSDASTAQLMEEFYKNLAIGKMTKSEALRKAQLSLLHPTNKSTEYLHPYYWSPFILMGNGL